MVQEKLLSKFPQTWARRKSGELQSLNINMIIFLLKGPEVLRRKQLNEKKTFQQPYNTIKCFKNQSAIKITVVEVTPKIIKWY